MPAGEWVTGVEGRAEERSGSLDLDDEIDPEQLVGCGSKMQDHLGVRR